MLRLVLLISGLTLAFPAASLNCVDKAVDSNNTTEIKQFNSREGKLLFFPGKGFDGVSINLVVHRTTTNRVHLKELCVNDSRWYKLEVKVYWSWKWYQECTFKVDHCSGKCGQVRDWSENDFQSFSVNTHGGSVWSMKNVENQAQCSNPDFSRRTNSTAASNTRKTNTRRTQDNLHGNSEVPIPWLVATGVSVFIVAAVVVVVLTVRKANRLRK